MGSVKVSRKISPLGREAKEASAHRRLTSIEYAELERKHEVSLAIADLVILHRTRARLTQEDLAARMKTSVSAISRLESGFHLPSIETLRKLADALGGRVQIDIVGIESNSAPSARRRRKVGA